MAKAPSPFISIFSVCLYLCVHIWAHTYIIEKLVTKLEQYLRFMGDLCVIYANIHVYMCLYTHTHTYHRDGGAGRYNTVLQPWGVGLSPAQRGQTGQSSDPALT